MSKKDKKKRQTKPLSRPKFLAMSKLIGYYVLAILTIIVLYTLFEMHIQADLSALPQLIISIFGLVATYVGFYLVMAKWEHLEQEKTARQKDIIKLKKELGVYDSEQECQCKIEKLEEEVQELEEKEQEVLSEDFTNN